MANLMDVHGIGKSLLETLKENGVNSVADLAGMTVPRLSQLPRIGARRAPVLIAAANALLTMSSVSQGAQGQPQAVASAPVTAEPLPDKTPKAKAPKPPADKTAKTPKAKKPKTGKKARAKDDAKPAKAKADPKTKAKSKKKKKSEAKPVKASKPKPKTKVKAKTKSKKKSKK